MRKQVKGLATLLWIEQAKRVALTHFVALFGANNVRDFKLDTFQTIERDLEIVCSFHAMKSIVRSVYTVRVTPKYKIVRVSESTKPTSPSTPKPAPPPVPKLAPPPVLPERKRLPDTRESMTRCLRILTADGAIKFYATVGFYPDGSPGEVFLRAGKAGSMISGLLDALAVCISIGLQSGVPLAWYVSKLRHMQFEPSGRVGSKVVGSVVDALAQWLEKRFMKEENV